MKDDTSPEDTHLVHLSSNAPLEIFPFVTLFHREVVLRHNRRTSR